MKKTSTFSKNDKLEKLFDYLGEQEDPESFQVRTVIVDVIASIKSRKYLGMILNYAGQLSAQEHCVDNEWIPRPEYKADTMEEIERLERLSESEDEH